MKTFIILLSSIAAFIFIIVLCTGFYVIPDYGLATSCDTCVRPGDEIQPGVLWYWRPGLDTGFITSDGGILIKLKQQDVAFFERLKLTAYVREQIRQKAFARFPYTDFLYKLSAGGRDPVKYDDAF
jgi:hypothetical protein